VGRLEIADDRYVHADDLDGQPISWLAAELDRDLVPARAQRYTTRETRDARAILVVVIIAVVVIVVISVIVSVIIVVITIIVVAMGTFRSAGSEV
jgi:hypothetical protein